MIVVRCIATNIFHQVPVNRFIYPNGALAIVRQVAKCLPCGAKKRIIGVVDSWPGFNLQAGFFSNLACGRLGNRLTFFGCTFRERPKRFCASVAKSNIKLPIVIRIGTQNNTAGGPAINRMICCALSGHGKKTAGGKNFSSVRRILRLVMPTVKRQRPNFYVNLRSSRNSPRK